MHVNWRLNVIRILLMPRNKRAIQPTKEQKQKAIEEIISGGLLVKVGAILGYSESNKAGLWSYFERDPEFRDAIYRARELSCWYLEDKMLSLDREYEDPKTMRVMLESYARILRYRDPKTYGEKIDMQVTTVDLTGALNEARERAQFELDVTPLPKQIKSK